MEAWLAFSEAQLKRDDKRPQSKISNPKAVPNVGRNAPSIFRGQAFPQ